MQRSLKTSSTQTDPVQDEAFDWDLSDKTEVETQTVPPSRSNSVNSAHPRTGANRAEVVKVAMDLASGGRITMDADEARLNLSENFAELTGGVTIVTSTGYRIESDMLRATLTEIEITSPGPVHATGPGGTLDAGAMHILAQDGEKPTQLVFKNGVKLIYDPKQIEERPEE